MVVWYKKKKDIKDEKQNVRYKQPKKRAASHCNEKTAEGQLEEKDQDLRIRYITSEMSTGQSRDVKHSYI